MVTGSGLDFGYESIVFEHVQRFDLFDISWDSIRSLSFPNLVSLRMYYKPKNKAEFTAFVKKHEHLQRLKFTTFTSEDRDLLQLTGLDGLRNLTDVWLFLNVPADTDSIVRFIENNQQLVRFKYGAINFNEEMFGELQRHLQDEWHFYEFEDSGFRGFVFERNNSNGDLNYLP